MSASVKSGLLLINLGTPEAPTPEKIEKYLREFLMDPYVVDIPWPLRWGLVNLLVLPKRKYASAELYRKVWTERGSPLLMHSEDLLKKISEAFPQPVWLAMRYGKPSIASVANEIVKAGIQKLKILPLYPQYSLAATESSVEYAKKVFKKLDKNIELDFIPAFYNHPHYLDAVAEVSREHLNAFSPDHVLFSFHGLPERQVKKTDSTGKHCLGMEHCCEVLVPANKNCYRAQCFWTARWVAKKLEIKDYTVAFQSRLGRTPWIKPYSDHLYEEFPKKGIRRLAVLSPSFVADCLETLEEIGIRAKEQFVRAGGEDLRLIPSLNSDPLWVEAIKKIAG